MVIVNQEKRCEGEDRPDNQASSWMLQPCFPKSSRCLPSWLPLSGAESPWQLNSGAKGRSFKHQIRKERGGADDVVLLPSLSSSPHLSSSFLSCGPASTTGILRVLSAGAIISKINEKLECLHAP